MKNKTDFLKNSSITSKLFLCSAMLLCLLMGAGSVHADSTQTAVVATAASDYSSYGISAITVDPKAGPRIAVNNLLAGSNGSTVKTFGQYYYRIEQFQADNVTKVDISSPNTPIWQFSTQDTGEATSSNPYDLIFVNSSKAYLLRYGSTKAWIINPSVSPDNEAGFKIGELDLSAYADSDGVPEMCCGVLANNKLFIVMQRTVDWCPTEIAYVAVFDTATDTEINTGMGSGSMIGIPLTIKNPGSIQYIAENNRIYLQGIGSYPGSGACDPVYEYTGGIEGINPATYASSIVLDDGDATTHEYGAISGMSIASPTKGYFVGYAGWGDNTLYAFNPTTGVVSGAITGFQNINISGMNSGTYLDKNAMMWVCDATKGQVKIMDTENNTISENVDTNLNPQKVAFCTQGTPLAPTLGSTVSGNNVMVHWNTVSGANGYYLWVTQPLTGWTTLYDWGTRTSVSATLAPTGAPFYVTIIPYNAEGTGAASNVVAIQAAGE